MSSRKPYDGPKWRQLDWYLHHIDREHRLGHQERHDAAATALLRTLDAATALPNLDPYDLGRAAIAHARQEHLVEHREPIPGSASPLDLDAVLGPQAATPPRRLA